MAEAAVVLLEQARAKREQAARARRLAQMVIADEVVECLEAFARELDITAAELERQAERAALLASNAEELVIRSGTLRRELGNEIARTKRLVSGRRKSSARKPKAP